jgi:hypothetical protein
MAGLKLAKLPDRTSVRMTIAVSPELNRSLLAYAEAYCAAYGASEKISDLIPAMLEMFLASDKEFVRAYRNAGSASVNRSNE